MDAISEHLPKAIAEWKIDFALVNGENAASTGFGITEAAYDEIIAAHADIVTLGNHSWSRKEALDLVERVPRLLRPIIIVMELQDAVRQFFKQKMGAACW